jgi:hypothetical protein
MDHHHSGCNEWMDHHHSGHDEWMDIIVAGAGRQAGGQETTFSLGSHLLD